MTPASSRCWGLPFGEGEFDVAVAAWMLYHAPDLDRALAELARVLKPAGRLVAVTAASWEDLASLVAAPPLEHPIRVRRHSTVFVAEKGS